MRTGAEGHPEHGPGAIPLKLSVGGSGCLRYKGKAISRLLIEAVPWDSEIGWYRG